MTVNSSYSVEITNAYAIFFETFKIYRLCVKKLVDVCLSHYDDICDLSPLQARRYIEVLVHATRNNSIVKYPFFDRQFVKFPSYLRRSAITEANGIACSYMKLLSKWKSDSSQHKGRKPTLCKSRNCMPVLYKGNCFRWIDDERVKIKLYINKDWVWREFQLSKSDIRYLRKLSEIPSAPVLEKRGHRFYLRFLFSQIETVSNKVDKICSVDLGINTDAVCSIMESDGTVAGRKFIDFPVEKDRMMTTVRRISKAQSRGARNTPKLWRIANNYNRELSVKISSAIVDYAVQNKVDCIVFEYLDLKGGGKGKYSQRISLWRKREIQKRAEALARKHGIKIRRVCAYNSSQLAYDGTGKVVRDRNNFQMCTFANGKRYNCDLSASYNIGARFFIKEKLKSLSETEELAISAKVPELAKRTSGLTTANSTLSTLISLNAAL